MKLYDLVKDVLIHSTAARNSDKYLLWHVWDRLHLTKGTVIDMDTFLSDSCPSAESVTRARRKIQENHPNLQADPAVQAKRKEKEQSKGTFVYREETDTYVEI